MQKIPGQANVYFKNLNAIRFIAALLVIIQHIEQLKSNFGLPNHWSNSSIHIIGKLGVVLFFVLSGFLITFLLFKEKEVTQTISIKDFYIRRMLRIWPLYFLIIFLAFFVLPFSDFFLIKGFGKEVVWHNISFKLPLFILFLPNLATTFGTIPYASQTWSIGAEEQFYLVWPVLNKKISNKWVLMFAVIFFYLGLKIFLGYLPSNVYLNVFRRFWDLIPIDCMAIGGLFALVVYQNNTFTQNIRKILFSKFVQWPVLLLTVSLIVYGVNFTYFHFEIYALLFGIILTNFACNENRIFSMENPVLNYLGKISYGLYMFHPIAVVIAIRAQQKLDFFNNILLYISAVAVSVLIAALSYEFFEKRFIKKKVKYSKVISGDNARE